MNARRIELNKSRLVLLLALLFAILGASLFRTPPILLMAGVLCAAPLCATLAGRRARRFLQVSREFPAVGSVGDEVTGRLTLQNGGKWPIFLVQCRLKLDLKRDDGRRAGMELLSGEEHLEPVLGPLARVMWEEKWRLLRRGEQEIPGVSVGSSDPLGLQNHLDARAQGRHITVLPRPLPLSRLGWTGQSRAGQRPPLQAARVAEASDFHGVRAHRPGEGLRRIHWKSTARTGQLHVVEWEEEMAHDLTLLLDVEASVHDGTPGDDSLEAMVSLAASIAAFLLQNGHCFSLMWLEDAARAPSDAPPRFRRVEARHLSGLEAVLRALSPLECCKASHASLSHLVAQAAPHLGGESAVLLVTTERADLGAAQNQLDAAMPRSGQTAKGAGQSLIIDAASFAPRQPSQTATASASATARAKKASKSTPSKPLSEPLSEPPLGAALSSHGPRLRRGDSLVAFLERGA